MIKDGTAWNIISLLTQMSSNHTEESVKSIGKIWDIHIFLLTVSEKATRKCLTDFNTCIPSKQLTKTFTEFLEEVFYFTNATVPFPNIVVNHNIIVRIFYLVPSTIFHKCTYNSVWGWSWNVQFICLYLSFRKSSCPFEYQFHGNFFNPTYYTKRL